MSFYLGCFCLVDSGSHWFTLRAVLVPVCSCCSVLPASIASAACLLFVVCGMFGSAGIWWWSVFVSPEGMRQGIRAFLSMYMSASLP